MPTFWSMPCKKGACLEYRRGWMQAIAERWKLFKEIKGPFRHITRWHPQYTKKTRPNPMRKKDERRWRRLGYD